MGAAHLHLILNHVPVLGVVFAGLLLGTALWYRSPQFQRLALVMVVGSALVAVPVYLTGEGAEDMVEGMAGVSRASLVVVAATLPMFGLPEAALLLIMGIDVFLDMGRTATNVIGNSIATAVVAKWEGKLGESVADKDEIVDMLPEGVLTAPKVEA